MWQVRLSFSPSTHQEPSTIERSTWTRNKHEYWILARTLSYKPKTLVWCRRETRLKYSEMLPWFWVQEAGGFQADSSRGFEAKWRLEGEKMSEDIEKRVEDLKTLTEEVQRRRRLQKGFQGHGSSSKKGFGGFYNWKERKFNGKSFFLKSFCINSMHFPLVKQPIPRSKHSHPSSCDQCAGDTDRTRLSAWASSGSPPSSLRAATVKHRDLALKSKAVQCTQPGSWWPNNLQIWKSSLKDEGNTLKHHESSYWQDQKST